MNKQYQKDIKIVMLPSENEGVLHKTDSGLFLNPFTTRSLSDNAKPKVVSTPQHLYAISDGNPKTGELAYHDEWN